MRRDRISQLQEIRIDEHSGCEDFAEAAFELGRCLLDEEVHLTFWAKFGLAKPPWDEDGGMEQAREILWVFGIIDSAPVLNAIVNTCRSGSPSDDEDLKTALLTQHALSAAISLLELPKEGELEREEPGEEVETVDRGGAPVTSDPWAGFVITSWPEEAEPGP